MNRLGVIDWLGLVMNCAHSVQSPRHARNWENSPAFELREINFRIAQQLYLVAKQRKWVGGIIAMDDRGSYWRHSEVSAWYAEHARFSATADGLRSFLRYDNSIREIMADGSVSDALAMAKCPKDEELKIMDTIKLVGTDGEVAEAPVQWVKVPEEHLFRLPTYKGNRKNKPWMFDTPPDKFYKSAENCARWFGGLLGFKVVKVARMEADDICAVASEKATEDWNIDILTGDSDYHQLAINPFVTVLDLSKGEFTAKSSRDILRKLGAKIISGDKSDNISGLAKGKKGCFGKDAAEKLMAPFSGTTKAELGKYLLEMGQDSLHLLRNIRLIGLPANDAFIKDTIRAAISAEPKQILDKTWEDFYLTERERNYLDDKVQLEDFTALFAPNADEEYGL